MLNFYALSSSEFGDLSKDILQKITGKLLYMTDSTNDHGVDITDDRSRPALVGQAKHYISSTTSELIHALKKEKENMQRVKPEEYYLFVSKDLTMDRINQIIDLLSPVVKISHEHIFTLKVLDGLLQTAQYKDVLYKHHKLWNFSVDILNHLLNKSIQFDATEMLLDMKQYEEFVPTEIYRDCIETLEQQHMLLVQGAPGSGKTITSKMTALDYANQGYTVHYTTDGNISEIKRAIANDDSPELVLLDDFLGQLYFSLDIAKIKALDSLLSYIKRSKNKRIILNSRITIYQEAHRFLPFGKLFMDVPVISTDSLTQYEKARILKNYLKRHFDGQREIIDYIASESRYKDIIEHRNFSPRIIESIFLLISEHTDSEVFRKGLLQMLNNPKQIWAAEFEINLRPVDRVLLTTLYSLTNTEIEYDVLRECFNARINRMPEVDKTVNQFELVLGRLNKSMVRTTVSETRKVAALNPSVNDFLRSYISNNQIERDAIVQSAIYFEQIYKVLLEGRYECATKNPCLLDLLNKKIEDHSILALRFFNLDSMGNILLWYCVIEDQKEDDAYRAKIIELIIAKAVSNYTPFSFENYMDYISPLFCEPLSSYYDIKLLLTGIEFIEGLINCVKHDKDALLQLLKMIWNIISKPAPGLRYDIEAFRKRAVEEAEIVLYNAVPDIADFIRNDYSWFEFDAMVEHIDMNCHSDDIIDYCESDLRWFLEEDLIQQYVDFGSRYIDHELADMDFITCELKIDRDVLLIDKDIQSQVDAKIDMVLSDILRESIYDEYTGQKRESKYNMAIERRQYDSFETLQQTDGPIIELFYDLKNS